MQQNQHILLFIKFQNNVIQSVAMSACLSNQLWETNFGLSDLSLYLTIDLLPIISIDLHVHLRNVDSNCITQLTSEKKPRSDINVQLKNQM